MTNRGNLIDNLFKGFDEALTIACTLAPDADSKVESLCVRYRECELMVLSPGFNEGLLISNLLMGFDESLRIAKRLCDNDPQWQATLDRLSDCLTKGVAEAGV